VKTGKSIRHVVLTKGLLSEKQLDEILSVEKMTRCGVTGKHMTRRAGGTGHAAMAGQRAQTAPSTQARKKRSR